MKKEKFVIPDLTDEEFAWFAITLSYLKPKRAVEIFVRVFERWPDLDEDLDTVKEALREKCQQQNRIKRSRIYNQIKRNKAELSKFRHDVLDAYTVFDELEYWTVMQEMFLGIREIDPKVLRLLDKASKIRAESYIPFSEVEVSESGTESENPFADLEMESDPNEGTSHEPEA